ncbi:MAG: ribonuclease HII [Firmicutes bacterium]|nr:ribonuclease HII [Bacillota bacterium]
MKKEYSFFSTLTIEQIRHYVLSAGNLTEEEIVLLREDRRAGVRELLAQYLRRKKQLLQEKKRLAEMNSKEEELYKKGCLIVAGVDEAGRGPLAGPVVAAAVVLGHKADLLTWEGISDSKQLSPQKRETLYQTILARSTAVGLGIVNADIIDKINIHKASLEAMKLAVEQLRPQPDFILTDGFRIPEIDFPQEAIKGGDRLCLSIAAASIVAKVTRDRLMEKYEQLYPGYGFAKNKGYPTPEHRKAIRSLGLSELHRRTFRLL